MKTRLALCVAAMLLGMMVQYTRGQAAPSITVQPSPAAVQPGQPALFSVTATGPTLSYQWRKGEMDLVDGDKVSGARTATLTISAVTMDDTLSPYDVVVSNDWGTATSQPVYITVQSSFDWLPWQGTPGPGGPVYAMTTWSSLQGQWLVVGGIFAKVGNMVVNSIAAWDGANWHALGSGMGGQYAPYVTALTVYNGELIAGGIFKTAGGVTCNYIARWDGSNWQPLGSGLNERVRALTVYNGRLVAAGMFWTAGGVRCNRIASWDGTSWQSMGDGMTSGPNYTSVGALAVYKGQLVAGGWFSWAGGVACKNIARWDGSSWQPLGKGTTGSVNTLVVYSGQLVVGGHFGPGEGDTYRYIARWDGNNWQPLGTGMNGEVNTLSVYNGQLVAAGEFGAAGGIACNHVARWNGNNWQPMREGANGGVHALGVYNGQLVAGGSFMTGWWMPGSPYWESLASTSYWARWGLWPTILVQPASQSVAAGNTLTLSVSATGLGTLTYQWRRGGANLADDGRIAGVSADSLTIANVTSADTGCYEVAVTDASGTAVSSTAVVAVGGPIAPSNPSPDGQGNLPLDTNLSCSWPLPGATFDIYLEQVYQDPPESYVTVVRGLSEPTLMPALSPGGDYYWWVVAVTGNGKITGPIWSFSVHGDIPGDINGDGYVNVGDLQLLVAAWGSGPNYTGREDVNHDGFVNVGDLQLLVSQW